MYAVYEQVIHQKYFESCVTRLNNNNNNNSLFRTLNKFTLAWNLSKLVHNKVIEELKKKNQ